MRMVIGIRFYRESDLRIRLRVSIKSRLTEEVQPDYVVLTLPIGKPHQERPIKKTHQEGQERFFEKFLKKSQISTNVSDLFRENSQSLIDLDKSSKRVYISPLIAEGLLSMTDPDRQLAETKCLCNQD